MNEKEWNELSDAEKNGLIAEADGWTYLVDIWKMWKKGEVACMVEPPNYLGDMNLCMELGEGYNYSFMKFEDGYACLLTAKSGRQFGSGTHQNPRMAFSTAYAKAVGIITEE